MTAYNKPGGDDGLHTRSYVTDQANVEVMPKITRRTACLLGAGWSTAAFLSLPANQSVAAENHDIQYVLTDLRYPESLEFGAALNLKASNRLEVTKGLTRVWRDALVPMWNENGGTIAGLTQPETWACVAEQARSCGRRSLFIGRHRVVESGDAIEHVLSGSLPLLRCAATLERSGETWPRVMAYLALQRQTHSRRVADKTFRTPATTVRASSTPLVSWIIA